MWLSWLEHLPVNQNVMSSITSQGTWLGFEFGPQLGLIPEATNPLSPFFLLSLKSISMSLGEDKKSPNICL